MERHSHVSPEHEVFRRLVVMGNTVRVSKGEAVNIPEYAKWVSCTTRLLPAKTCFSTPLRVRRLESDPGVSSVPNECTHTLHG